MKWSEKRTAVIHYRVANQTECLD